MYILGENYGPSGSSATGTGGGTVKPTRTQAQMQTVIRFRDWSAGTFCSRSELDYELVIYGFENTQGHRETVRRRRKMRRSASQGRSQRKRSRPSVEYSSCTHRKLHILAGCIGFPNAIGRCDIPAKAAQLTSYASPVAVFSFITS